MTGDASARRGGRGRGGFTLLEVMIAMSVLAIAMFGLLASFNTVVRLREVVEQEVYAANAIKHKFDEIRADAAEDFDAMIYDYSNDPDLICFHVQGIDRQDAEGTWLAAADSDKLPDSDGEHFAGEVVLHLDGSMVPEEFGLTATDATGRFGTLALTDDVVVGEIKLLPVEVRVQWWRPGADRNRPRAATKLRRFLLLARKN